MITQRFPISVLIGTLTLFATAHAQPAGEREEDTIRTYRLGEVTISGERAREVTPTTVQQIPFATIARTDAPTAASMAQAIPAARVQTNSRGEALLYLRGTGERQVALFLDGALLNVPWDNRVDLSLVPLATVGGITVARGVTSVLYGANTLGGAVNMVSQERRDPGFLTEAVLSGGSGSALNASLVHMGSTGGMNYVAAASLLDRAGLTVSGEYDPKFNQADGELRTNTDQHLVNLYGRVEVRPDFDDDPETDDLTAGLAVNFIDGRKGVAPETHVEDGRFWRYPLWRYLAVTMNAQNPTLFRSEHFSTRLALWYTTFEQQIDQFTSVAYALRSGTEEDLDRTLGARAVIGADFEETRFDLSINALSSTHEQRDLVYDSTGALIPFRDATGAVTSYPTLEYQQRLASIGLEMTRTMGETVTAVLGASWDAMSTPMTGDKPALDGFSDWGATAGISYDLNGAVLRGSAGRKVRFPTMRELYGEALKRFLINPDLKPEEAVMGELALDARADWGTVSAAGFGYVVKNTIDQRTVDTLGRRRRQRINLEGSRTWGVEASAGLRALAPLRLDVHGTFMLAEGIATDGGGADSTFHLSEKPEFVGALTLEYPLPLDITPSVEVVHTGRAWSLDDDNVFQELAPSTVLNARVAWSLFPGWTENTVVTVFARVNNVTDAVVLPQLGLPGQGREVQAGVKVAM